MTLGEVVYSAHGPLTSLHHSRPLAGTTQHTSASKGFPHLVLHRTLAVSPGEFPHVCHRVVIVSCFALRSSTQYICSSAAALPLAPPFASRPSEAAFQVLLDITCQFSSHTYFSNALDVATSAEAERSEAEPVSNWLALSSS